jgi:hypothetical protein
MYKVYHRLTKQAWASVDFFLGEGAKNTKKDTIFSQKKYKKHTIFVWPRGPKAPHDPLSSHPWKKDDNFGATFDNYCNEHQF